MKQCCIPTKKKDTQLLKPQKTEPVIEGELEKEWEQR